MTASLETLNLDHLAASLTNDADLLEAQEKIAQQLAQDEAQAQKDAAPAQAPAPAEVKDEPIVVAHVPGTFKELTENVTPQAITVMTGAIGNEYDNRIAFEKSQPAISGKMLPNLEAAQKRMTSEASVRAFCAMDIDPGFLNREISTGTRFNVYALEKINDLVVGLTAGFVKNAINRAILTSLFKFADAGVPFTGAAAAAAVSDKIKVDRKIGGLLTRHTASPSTAPTQKSQVMNSLQVLGIVTSNRQKGENEVFTLTDTPQTRKLREVLLPTT